MRLLSDCGIELIVQFNVLHFHLAGSRLVVRVNVGHQRVSRAVHSFADDTTVFLLAYGMFVGNVTLERSF